MDLIVLVAFSSWLAPAFGEHPFYQLLWRFDTVNYESLRIGGMVFAVVLFLLGIFLIVSKYGQFEKRCHHPGISAPCLKYKQPRKAGEL
uniref:FXYD domain-containing ion transport regulator n=1 Tax=Oryzias latipes TaxID=8090 RepID=A0A3B3H3X1_ORYLA